MFYHISINVFHNVMCSFFVKTYNELVQKNIEWCKKTLFTHSLIAVGDIELAR